MEKISVASLDPPDHCGWLTKQGGSIKTWKRRWMVLKGTTLYYFKTQKDVDVTGSIDLEPTSIIKEEPGKSKPKKHMLSVGTTKRTFMMFAETQQEQAQWVSKLKKALNSLHASPTPSASTTSSQPTNQNNGNSPAANGTIPADADSRDKLAYIKNGVSFLQTENKVLEFWKIWIESVATKNELEPGKRIEFTIAASADLAKLTWRVAGPQNIFIQKMVDFFWNVGAPETEIDRLNDVGAMINPVKIGSWIDMSVKDGMDGGWFFPVPMALSLCIDAADPGTPTQQLAEWAAQHGVEQCLAVGRDMGAAPPRQTEFRLALPGDASAQLDVALAAFSHFNFPSIPPTVLAILQSNTTPGLLLSVITSSEGFVRLGVLQPKPSEKVVKDLIAAADAQAAPFVAFQQQFQAAGSDPNPAYAEYQYLQTGFGYGVYKEGFDVVFHWNAATDIGQ